VSLLNPFHRKSYCTAEGIEGGNQIGVGNGGCQTMGEFFKAAVTVHVGANSSYEQLFYFYRAHVNLGGRQVARSTLEYTVGQSIVVFSVVQPIEGNLVLFAKHASMPGTMHYETVELPPGLAMSATGEISGTVTPVLPLEEATIYNISADCVITDAYGVEIQRHQMARMRMIVSPEIKMPGAAGTDATVGTHYFGPEPTVRCLLFAIRVCLRMLFELTLVG
jgi:hypothetical protein